MLANLPNVDVYGTVRVSIIVPSTEYDRPIDDAAFVERVETVMGVMCAAFGGATTVDTLGAYRADDGSVIVENGVRVESFGTPAAVEHHAETLAKFAAALAGEWLQESIALEIDGTLYGVRAA